MCLYSNTLAKFCGSSYVSIKHFFFVVVVVVIWLLAVFNQISACISAS